VVVWSQCEVVGMGLSSKADEGAETRMRAKAERTELDTILQSDLMIQSHRKRSDTERREGGVYPLEEERTTLGCSSRLGPVGMRP
jgi:hypothetical protein